MWNTVRIAYFEDVKAPLLLGPVHDAVAHLRTSPGVQRIMVLPHWKYGPHVDLIAECERELFERELFPACEALIAPWLAAHPSTTVLDPAAYASLSEKIALAELEMGPYLPLLDNNSVSRASYTPTPALRLPAIADAKATFLSRALDLTFRLLRVTQTKSDERLLTLAAMMGVVGQTYMAGGLARGFLSYRSHAEYFFAAYDQRGVLRARFDALDRALGARIDENLHCVVRDALGEVELTAPYRDVLAEWQQIAEETARETTRIVAEHYDALVDDQTISRMAEDLFKQMPATREARPEREPSAVWVAVQQDEGQRVMRSPEFLAFRTTVNFFYMLLPILEITPAQKFCLCHLVANATERIFDTSWQQLMGVASAQRGEVA